MVSRGGSTLKLVLILKQANLTLEKEDKGYCTHQTALHAAAAASNFEMAQCLLLYHADVDAKDSNDQTPLHYAVRLANRELVVILVSWGSNVQCRDKDGRQPLHIAVESASWTIVDVLLGAGADINARAFPRST